MVIDIDREFAHEEYAALSYNTRCWIRIRTEIVASLTLVVGLFLGNVVIP